MALDHRRLIGPGKKKSGQIFCVGQDYYTAVRFSLLWCELCGECFNEHEQSYAPTYTKATIFIQEDKY